MSISTSTFLASPSPAAKDIDQGTQCHNMRGPGTSSPAQSEASMLHRRIHANPTAEEHQQILEFLQGAN